MKIFETHSHYDDSAFDDDRDELISQMLSDNGELEYLINVGASLDGCKKSLELADKYDKVYAAVGVHPEDVGNLTMHDIQWLKKQALNNEKLLQLEKSDLIIIILIIRRKSRKCGLRRRLKRQLMLISL